MNNNKPQKEYLIKTDKLDLEPYEDPIISKTMNEVNKVICEAVERQEDFIIKTVIDWMGIQTEMDRIVISKEILTRAMICFKEEHRAEYDRLVDECTERNKGK